MTVKCITDIDLDKHFYTFANDIKQIIKPLTKHGIIYFGYSRLHPNGIADCFSNIPISQKIFIEKKCYKFVFVGEIEQYSHCIVCWDDLAIGNKVITEFFFGGEK